MASYKGSPTRRAAIGGTLFFWSLHVIPISVTAAQKTYGIVVPDTGSEYYDQIIAGTNDEAKRLGDVNLIEKRYTSLSQLSSIIADMISVKVAGVLIVSAGFDDDISAALKVVNEAGIPSVVIDGTLQKGASANVLPDLAKAAQLQAEVAMKASGSPAGPFIYMTGPKGEVSSILQDAFRSTGNAKVLEITLDSYSEDEVVGKTEGALSKEPAVVAIAASSDFLALSALKVTKRTGKDIKVIGLGATREGLEAVKKGEMTATITLRPEIQGSQGLEVLNNIANTGVCPNGQKPPCPPKTITPEVVAGGGQK